LTVDLTWNDNSAVEDGYQVWGFVNNCPTEGACETGDKTYLIAEPPANSTTYRRDSCGHDEYVWVLAVKERGGSDSAFWYPE